MKQKYVAPNLLVTTFEIDDVMKVSAQSMGNGFWDCSDFYFDDMFNDN